MMKILLTTLNARYSHASLGLRYLKANMAELYDVTEIVEYTIQQSVDEIVENIEKLNPQIVGFGVYIWNIEQTTKIVQTLKVLRPEMKIVLGGPEVSYEYEDQPIVQRADFLITGWGDISFPELCRQLLSGLRPMEKVIVGIQPPLDEIILPYDEYTEEDIKQRTVYVEASRGCPFTCEFCLSSLDKKAWSFPLPKFMQAMDKLYLKGLRQYKFVDRTFNLKTDFTTTILTFFLDKLARQPEDKLFLHFELVPDHLSDELKELILQFPEGSLQFEIGIQTLNLTTQKHISRRTNLLKAEENIRWLVEKSHVHLHVDLIAGLPAEDLASFGEGMDRLYAWKPHEIQLGILKRLKGTPIIRHTDPFGFKYSPEPPFSVMENNDVNFEEMNHMKRLAKYWDLVINSGRFKHIEPLLLESTPFANMTNLTNWLYKHLGRSHAIRLEKLFELVYEYLKDIKKVPADILKNAVTEDFLRTGIQGWPKVFGEAPEDWKERLSVMNKSRQGNSEASLPKRQQRHVE
ncbi:B12-binding domain-containing radical SAM protein [Thorsellia kenyensis]|uniref:DUF4080 domain-containing protein n=1 Tax=Thorsellia kenyensis TaxID=1549888 RepID=A0ABV6CA40_9GAMM